MAIKRLFEKQTIDVNAQNEDGSTLLSIAVWNDHYDLAQILIETYLAEVD